MKIKTINFLFFYHLFFYKMKSKQNQTIPM